MLNCITFLNITEQHCAYREYTGVSLFSKLNMHVVSSRVSVSV